MKNNKFLILLHFVACCGLFFSCVSPKKVETEEKQPISDTNDWKSDQIYFQAIGTEPFWSVSISDNTIEWATPEGKIHFPGSTPIQAADANVKKYVTEDGKGNRLEVQIVQKSCNDGMSDQEYLYQVEVQLTQKETTNFQGCGNYLLHEKLIGKWKLVSNQSSDKPIILEFDSTEITFSGHAHCNRYFGSLLVEKNSLRFQNIGSTRIACGENHLEQTYLEKLSEVTSYRLVDKHLILILANGEDLKFGAF